MGPPVLPLLAELASITWSNSARDAAPPESSIASRSARIGKNRTRLPSSIMRTGHDFGGPARNRRFVGQNWMLVALAIILVSIILSWWSQR
jgi:hypothetical protein